MKTRRGKGQLYMLAIDVAQLVINKICIKNVLLLKILAVRAPLVHPPESVAVLCGQPFFKDSRRNHTLSILPIQHCCVSFLFLMNQPPTSTRRPEDVSEMSLKCLSAQDLQGTLKEPKKNLMI